MSPLIPRRAVRALALSCLAAALGASLALADVDPQRLHGLRARSIGPAGMSGRIAALEAVESQPEVVYAGAATGGVWKSTNAGLTWQPLFDDQPVHAVGSIAIFQPNPQVVWVGTGEGNVRNSASVGNGVYRSLDGGRTWSHAGLEKTERVHRLLAHPSNPEVAWACAMGQAWGENPERGVFRTDDGGRSWRKVLYVDEKTGCGELALDPGNPNKLIAGLWQYRRWPWFFKSGGPGSGMYVTHDGGATWRKAQEEDGLPKGELGRMGIAFSRSQPEIVYALVEAEASALLRSEDGGRTWRKVNEQVNVAPRPFYFGDIRVDPAWPNRVYSVDYVIRVSDDGGRSFKVLPGAAWSEIHGDYHALWIDPADPRRMYSGNDGGVAVSHDRGQTFRFVANLPLAQFYHVAVDLEQPYHVYGGLQDNGSWRGPSSAWQRGGIRNHHWLEVGGGDGFEVLPHPKDPQQGYSLWQGGNLMRWSLRTGEARIVKPAPPEGLRLRFNWNAALATDPFAPDTVYLGSQFVHRSTDRGESWQVVSPDLTSNNPEWQKSEQSGGLTPDVTSAETFTTLVSIAPSPVEKGVIWTGSDDGRVHVTRDGGQTWTSVEGALAGVPAGTWVPHVEASPHDAGTAFVVFDNHRRSDWTPYLFRTDDYGKSWRPLASPGLRGYALVLRQDPVKKELLYLGTEFGLYVSFDGGTRWTRLEKTIPTASVMDLVVHPREHDLVIATHGRALWILDDVRPLRALTEESLKKPLELFDVADAQQHWRRSEEGGFGFGAGEFRGQDRPYGAILTFALDQPGLPLFDAEKERARKEQERQAARQRAGAAKAGEQKPAAAKADEPPRVEVVVTDAAGRLVRRFKAPAHLGLNRAVWDLRSEPGRELPRAEDDPRDEDDDGRAGPEVVPGTYTVTLKHGGHEASRRVQVLADPRSSNTAADWQRRWEALGQARALHDQAAEAIWRLRRTRDDVALVQAKARQAAEDAGEKDKAKLSELPLVKDGDELKRKLTDVEKRLWQAPEAKGIQADTDVMSRLGEPLYFMASSWEPPSPTHLLYLAQAEKALGALLPEIDKLFAQDVAAFQARVLEARIGLLALPAPAQP